jgi:1,4-alpha-glucan branching enzyme
MTQTGRNDLGTFCLVLHTHLPWLNHHGSWPVGEEWLYQSWSAAYDPVFNVLDRLADEGRTNLLTLGMTPVLAAQLDDPYTITNYHSWLSDWQWRAAGMTAAADSHTRRMGAWESDRARTALDSFEKNWSRGASPILRRLVDGAAIELLGGPATHPFQPLLREEVARFSLETGLDDTQLRVGSRPRGIWAPECGYRPGLADVYAAAGVSHFMMDGPSLRHIGVDTDQAHPIADTNVIAFGRDLDVTYRVWSPKRGYPGGKWYRDFHAHNLEWGFRHQRVTSHTTAPQDKAPYDPVRANAAVLVDVDDFVNTVVNRLRAIRAARGRPGIAVAAFDTELFGHWWLEGPQWLEQVLRRLPEAGINVTTVQGAIDSGHLGQPISPESGSWGAGKDWHIWDGGAVTSMVADQRAAQIRVLDYLQGLDRTWGRSQVADQLVRNLMLALASDWAFMVSHDSAAEYARSRHHDHIHSLNQLADAVRDVGWNGEPARHLAAQQRATDGPFGHLDARRLA